MSETALANAAVQAREMSRARKIDRTLNWLPYVALAGSTLMALFVPEPGLLLAPVRVTLAVVAVTAVWLALVGARVRSAWAGGVFFAGLLLCVGVLIWCSPLYGFFAWTGYLWTLRSLRGRWQVAGAAAVAVLTAVSQLGGYSSVDEPRELPVFAVILALNAGIATAMTRWTAISDAQNERRQQMLGELADANAKLAAALTENAGLHAQLLAQAREAGVLDERQRMAGEIHDVLAQGLTGIVTQLEAADQAAGRPDDWRRHLDQARRLARDGLTEARRSVQALRPQPLAEAALPVALAEMVDGWSQRSGVRAELITTGTAVPLLPDIEAALFRTGQEALANVARHAAASRVALTLSYMEDLVTLDVRDDGAGFDPAAPRPERRDGGYGLVAMHERVRRVAGTLEVESEPGNGTAISACVPAVPVHRMAAA